MRYFVDQGVCQARTVSAPRLHTLAIWRHECCMDGQKRTYAALARLEGKPVCGRRDAFHHSKTEVVQKFLQVCLMRCINDGVSVSIWFWLDRASPVAKHLDNEHLDYAPGPGQCPWPTPIRGTLSCKTLLYIYLANNIFERCIFPDVPAYMTWSHLELLGKKLVSLCIQFSVDTIDEFFGHVLTAVLIQIRKGALQDKRLISLPRPT